LAEETELLRYIGGDVENFMSIVSLILDVGEKDSVYAILFVDVGEKDSVYAILKFTRT
jgi:hypothetical protein